MKPKDMIVIRNAYPVGLADPLYCIKKGKRVTVLSYDSSSVGIQTRWGTMFYRSENFRDLTNVEKLTGRIL
jgi:hypothetical protein